jgi:hypothetical protein
LGVIIGDAQLANVSIPVYLAHIIDGFKFVLRRYDHNDRCCTWCRIWMVRLEWHDAVDGWVSLLVFDEQCLPGTYIYMQL